MVSVKYGFEYILFLGVKRLGILIHPLTGDTICEKWRLSAYYFK
jgi:hypothetical protein